MSLFCGTMLPLDRPLSTASLNAFLFLSGAPFYTYRNFAFCHISYCWFTVITADFLPNQHLFQILFASCYLNFIIITYYTKSYRMAMLASRAPTWCLVRSLRTCDKFQKQSVTDRLGLLRSPSSHQTSKSQLFHVSAIVERSNAVRGSKCGNRDIFELRRVQDTMNKVMGVRGPHKKVAYKPSLRPTSAASAIGKHDFKTIKGMKVVTPFHWTTASLCV